jgi:hypothetical protein
VDEFLNYGISILETKHQALQVKASQAI